MKRLIPAPRAIEAKDGVFDIEKVTVFYDCGIDFRLKKAAGTLAREVSDISGELCPLSAASLSGKYINITAGEGGGEGYRLTVEKDRITVDGAGAAGAFYGVQTLRQLFKLYGGQIPCCVIDDAPDLQVRGFYQDVTRGRVNTLEKLKEIADMLAFYKINSLQLYIEDAFLFKEFEGIITEDEALTAEEMLEFDSYCYDRFIELIPSLSTFGHLFTLLQSDKYNYLCELEGHRMTTNYWMEKQWHHTVNVYEPDTIKVIGSMIEQYMALFRSDKFNICCDETMDLCSGKNKGRDKGEAYFYHLSGLIDILKRHGKTVMIWGDECMARPEMTKKYLPDDTIILNWCYHKSVNEWIPKFFSDLGYNQIVCPGTASWSKFIEDIDTSVGNITEFSAHAKKYGALGLLNTNWGDFGHICSFNCNLYGTLFGAEKSWRVDSAVGDDFRRSASLLLYGVTELDIVETIYSLGRAELTCDWCRFVMWHSANCLEGRQTELKYSEDGDLTESDAKYNISVCENEIRKLSALSEGDKTALGDVILAARAIALMNREYLYVNGASGYTDGAALQSDFNLWLEDYKASWLRSDKPSQLWRLADFISHITEVPVKKL